MSTSKDDEKGILQRLRQLEKEYMRKKRKLKRSKQAAAAKAHVRQRILEQLQGQKVGDIEDGTGAHCPVNNHTNNTDDGQPLNPSTESGEREGPHSCVPQPMSPTIKNEDDNIIIGSQDIFASPKHEHSIADHQYIENQQKTSNTINEHLLNYISENPNSARHVEAKPLTPEVASLLSTPIQTSSTRTNDGAGCSRSSKYKRKNFVTKLDPSSPDVSDKPTDINKNMLTLSQDQSNEQQNVAFKTAEAIIYERQQIDKGSKLSGNQKILETKHVNCTCNEIVKSAVNENLLPNSNKENSKANQLPFNRSIEAKGKLAIGSPICDRSDPPFDFPSSENKIKATMDASRKRLRRLSLPQRKSPRVCVQSSQTSSETTSNSSQEVLPLLEGSCSSKAQKSGRHRITTPRISNKRVIIASMFQCLVDEVKQNSEVEEFSIPDEYLDFCVKYASQCDLEEGKCSISHFEDQRSILNGTRYNKHDTVSAVEKVKLSAEHVTSKSDDSSKVTISPSQKEKLTLLKMEISDISENRPCDQCTSVNTSKTEDTSPTLFESQVDKTEVFNFEKTSSDLGQNSEKNTSPRAVFPICDDFESTLVEEVARKTVNKCLSFESRHSSFGLAETDGCDSNMNSKERLMEAGDASSVIDLKVSRRISKKGDHCHNDIDGTTCMKQISCFQIPSECVHSMVCVETSDHSLYLACLCPKMLYMYTDDGDRWTCVASHPAKISLKRKTAPVLYGLKDCALSCVVMLENQSTSTVIACYTLRGTSLRKHTVNCLNGTGTLLCALPDEMFAVSYYRESRGHVTRYRPTMATGVWTSDSLEAADKPLTGLLTVNGLESVLLGITARGLMYIWNHDCGVLLSVVDMSDVCPKEPLCPAAFSEQGFLILPVLSARKQSTAGCLLVVNPHLGTSETLLTFQQQATGSNGCTSANLVSGLLVVRGNNAAVSIWDLYTGRYLSTIDNRNVTCLATANQIVALTHKQCVHVYAVLQGGS